MKFIDSYYVSKASDYLLSGSVRFTSSVTQKIILAVIDSLLLLFFFPTVVFFFYKDVIYLTVKFDNKDFSLRYIRLPAKKDPAPPPPPGNFADIVYLKEPSFLHRIRDVCTL